MMTLDAIREVAAGFPGAQESTSYGTPAFKVAKKLILRLHQKEDAIVLLLDTVAEQQDLISEDPMTFYITDHYEGYAAVLVRPTIDRDRFLALFERRWRAVARQRDIAELDG